MVSTSGKTVHGAIHQVTLVFLLFFSTLLQAQFYNLPADYFFSLFTEKQLAEKDRAIHTGLKPYVPFFSDKYQHVEDSHQVFRFITNDPAVDAVFRKHLIRIEPKTEKFKLRLDPLLHLETGRDFSDSLNSPLFNNTRGFIGSGEVGSKVYFETLFAESQSTLPIYLWQYAQATAIVPGQGRWKNFKSRGFDYAFSSGFVSIQLIKNINLQVGHGKHKIGNGYRSLLLSDNAFNYPYVRLTQQWWGGRLNYTNIYAVLMNLEPASKIQNPNSERLFQKKAASFQYLSFNPNRRINIGIFQGMIWQAGDERNQQHLSWQYFNPLILTNLGYYGLNNRNNLLIGSDLRLKFNDRLSLYGQVMADDLSDTKASGNAWGWQTGLTCFNAFGARNFFVQIELNSVKEQSYFSPPGTETNQSWSHYNQGLAFTPGSGNELIVIMDYRWRRFFVDIKYNYQTVQATGNDVNTQLAMIRCGYTINPAYNLNVYAGINYRLQNFSNFKGSEQQSSYVCFGIKTSLYNLYYDF